MMIDIKDIITLSDNKKYVVASKINYEGKTYYYLVDKNDVNNLKFCYEDSDELVETNDKELNTKLLPMFIEVSKKAIENDELSNMLFFMYQTKTNNERPKTK